MKAIEIIEILNQWAPPRLIDEWDNTGFQIGDLEKKVNKILISLDLDREVYARAVEERTDMIITHHPIIFKPLKSLTREDYKGKLICDIIKEDIAIYNAHTNLDLTEGGVNDTLAGILDVKNSEPLSIAYEEPLYKLVVFVPNSHAPMIRKVLGDLGAGWIGNYSHCTYNTKGMGTFMPRENSNPFIGKVNILEEVEEVKIETITREKDLKRILNDMINSHPYEEVAYDIYPLKNKGKVYGYGRVGEIPEMHLISYLDRVKKALDTEHLIVYGNMDRFIKRVAVCGGSGSSFIHDAYLKGADIYVTGDIKYHEAQYANELGLTIVDAGHYNTEKIILPKIKEYLKKKLTKTVEIQLYIKSSPPYAIY